jgi:hypothetical protein
MRHQTPPKILPDPFGYEWQRGFVQIGRKLFAAYLHDGPVGVVSLLPTLPDPITLEDPTPAEQQRRCEAMLLALDEIGKELDLAA